MIEKFKHVRFKKASIALILKCNEIIKDLRSQGYSLTLRQLYYQLVSRDIIPNHHREYKNLGSLINNARLAGLIDWSAIEDRTRGAESVPHWSTPGDIISSAASSFRIDKWKDQPCRVEVWVEKDALIGVLEKCCRDLDIPWFSCRGYASQTALYDASKRILSYMDEGKQPIIIHLGDHDPSGIDMSRDIIDRIEMMIRDSIDVRRIALNMDQVKQYNPPPNPAKQQDSRFKQYISLHGKSCWELDALSPSIIDELIREEVSMVRDDKKFKALKAKEIVHRDDLIEAADRWDEVASFLKS